jgi:4-amino-4-deoxy-L-arabinose transferase-like glycosyltransferase
MKPARAILLFVALLALHCAGNWALPLIDRDEPRFAETSREMLQRRDFVVPFFNGIERFDKPPLIYWAQCGAYTVFGENEFAARLPAAVFAALTALVLALWGARAAGPATGFRAALIFSLTLQTTVLAHASVADMPMVFFVALAAWCGWEWLGATENKIRVLWGCGCWLALAFGFLAKGPIGLVPFGMIAGLSFQRPRESRPSGWHWAAGTALLLGAVSLWGIPALLWTHGEFARVGLGRHVIERSFATMEGHGARGLPGYLLSLPFYFLTVWAGFFPWAIWLPASMRYYWRKKQARGSIEAFLVSGTALIFLIFTIVRTKLPHYTLPAFPFMGLLLALWWRDAAHSARTFRLTAIAAVCCLLVLVTAGLPFTARFSASERIYEAASPFLTHDMECATCGFEEPSLVWAFRRKIDAFLTPVAAGELASWMTQPGPRLCVIPDELEETLRPSLKPDWKVMRSDGLQIAKGKRVRLCAIIKQR